MLHWLFLEKYVTTMDIVVTYFSTYDTKPSGDAVIKIIIIFFFCF